MVRLRRHRDAMKARIIFLLLALVGAPCCLATNRVYTSEQFRYSATTNDPAQETIELREVGLRLMVNAGPPTNVDVLPTSGVFRLERMQEPDRIGVEVVTTSGCRVICLRATGDTPLRFQHLGVSARCIVMESRPGLPMHGLLFGASILPLGTNTTPAWPSIHQSVAGTEPRSVTLPRDCEFAVSEAFEVVAPIP